MTEEKKLAEEYTDCYDTRIFGEDEILDATELMQQAFIAGFEKGKETRNKILTEITDNNEKEVTKLEDEIKQKDKRIADAEELIKDLLGSENSCCEEEMFFEIRHKAENFLKE